MKPAFCLYCGQSTVAETDTIYKCPNGHEYFNNPVATSSVIFVKDGLALFSKRAFDPGKGKYDFPGGFLEYREDPVQGAIREMIEETSVVLKPEDLHLVAAYPGEYMPYTSVVDLMYVCTNWTGEFTPSDDSEALEWKPLSFVNDPQSNVRGWYIDIEAKVTALTRNLS